MATEVFQAIRFELPSTGKLTAARRIGAACGRRWFAENKEKLPSGLPEEVASWSRQAQHAWRVALAETWHDAKADWARKLAAARAPSGPPLDDSEKRYRRQEQLREAKRRQRERERERRLHGATHHEQITEKTIPMTRSAAGLLAAVAEVEGVNQGVLIERLLVQLAKRKHSALHRKWEKPYW